MKTLLALFAATLSSACLMQTSASQQPATHRMTMENRKSVNYLGIKNEMLVFEVNLNFDDHELKTLQIFDEDGQEIYSEKIRTNNFVKQYMFAKNASGKLQFTLRGKKSIMNETFQVN